jgi:hypothetical protein
LAYCEPFEGNQASAPIALQLEGDPLVNVGPRLRVVAVFLCGIGLGVTLAFALQVEADDPPPPTPPSDRREQPSPPPSPRNDDAATRRCETLSGLERSECERKIAVREESRSPMGREAREKEEKARAEAEAARASSAADPASDVADSARASSSRVRQASAPPGPDRTPKVNKADPPQEPSSEATEDSDTDTLDRPRR